MALELSTYLLDSKSAGYLYSTATSFNVQNLYNVSCLSENYIDFNLVCRERKQKIEDIRRNIRDAILVGYNFTCL